MTPSEHANETSMEHGKVTPLEVAHLDEAQIHEDTPKLDAEYVALLKPKRLGRVRHSRCKAWTNGHGLIWDPLQEVWVHEHSLTLDIEEVAWAQQNSLILDPQEDYMDTRLNDHMDTPEEALTPEDSLTRLYALEEARGLDQEVKRHRPYSNKQRYGACSKNPHGLSQPHGSSQIHRLSK